MRKFTLLLSTLLCLMAVQGFSQPLKHGPTDVYAYHYLALSCVSLTQTGSCQPYEVQRPEPGVTVQLFISPSPLGSGWHSHEVLLTRRPGVEFLPNYPQICVTGQDGYCNWFVRGSGWSGEYNVIMIPQDKTLSDGTVLHFPPYQDHYYAGVTIDDINGNPHTFDALVAAPYASGTYPDTRHLDSQGQPGYNRFGTTSCVKDIQKAAFDYYKDVHNSGQYRMAPRRISLPDGGKADNEADLNGQYYFSPWVGRAGGWNQWGVSVDIVNPNQFVDPNQSEGRLLQYLTMNKMMRRAGIRLSKVNQLGQAIGTVDQVTTYWYGQLLNHYICLANPLLPEPGR